MLSPLIEIDSTGRHKDFSAKLEPGSFQAWSKDRTDSGRLQFTQDLALLPQARLFKLENVGLAA